MLALKKPYQNTTQIDIVVNHTFWGLFVTSPSYSRSTAVRVTLLLAGFHVGIGGATGEKEQTTVAANDPPLLRNLLNEKWLARVRMSTSARPLGHNEKGPISTEDLLALENHPQFC